ncbi:hypothetical protein [Nocardioides sp. Arc9.136]|uniref:hypothetical protein n=1 Tax=Nocardioides sp. Arc9.136 TaxID=2996826 RepID=UPI0026652D77|nr:hypothetical protein [Nocardioides sp. Arc9.136]WKN46995.1 hypothetical protein OSR43_13205 [Nocardioides sp. Arc9.136]
MLDRTHQVATTEDVHRRRRRRARAAAALAIVLGVVAGGLAGTWWGLRQAEVHEASSVVLVNPLEGNPFSPDGRGDELVNLETEAQLVRSDVMAELVGAALGEDAGALLAGLSVSVPPNTQLLEVSARAATPEDAALRAQAFAETYLDFRQSRTESTRFDRAAELEEQIRDRLAEQETLSDQLAAAPPRTSRSAVLTEQVVNISAQIDELRAQLGATRGSTPDPGQVVTPAVVGSTGLPGGTVTAGLLGAAVGGVLAWLLTAGLGRGGPAGEVDPAGSARGPGSSGSAGGHAGAVPGIGARLPAPLLGAVPAAASAEAAVPLRAALLAAERARPLTVLLSHPTDAAGSASAVGLARSLAAAHLRTVLVDVRRPLGPPGRGLADVLRGDASVDEVALGEGSHLRMLGAGTTPQHLDDLAASPEAARLLAELRADADVLLVCTGGAADPRTQALAAFADTVLLEVHEQRLGPDEPSGAVDLESDVEQLRRVGAASVLLVLVTPAPARAAAPEAAAPGTTATALGASPARSGVLARSWRRVRLGASRVVTGRSAPVPAAATGPGAASSRGPGSVR